ncbi:MAG: GIY-YIG nuclease family protein [Tepidanaerobacteraceae bacterium]
MNRKDLIRKYKEREVTGGVYRILNTLNNKYLLASGIDIKGDRNRFDFSVATGSCVQMKLQKDWDTFGPKAFKFEVLDELKKEPEQDIAAFREELELFEEMWRERLSGEEY